MNWTPEQKNAVEAPISNLLVCAAAGSGKTQVLTGRIINRVQSGADISRLLVMTFTKAAASEMRARISKSLSESFLNEKDPKKKKHLKKQLSLADTADISTVHSFCGKILRSYFYEINLDPSFSIISDYDRSIMLSESLSETMDFYYDSEDAAFLRFVDLVSDSSNDNAAAEMIESAAKFAMSTPVPDRWLDNAKAIYSELSPGNDVFSKPLTAKYKSIIEEARDLDCSALDMLLSEPLLETLAQKLSSEISELDAFLSGSTDWDSCFRFSGAMQCARFSGGKSGADPVIKERAKKLHFKVSDLIKEAKALIDIPYSEAYEQTKCMAEYAILISDAAKKMLSIFAEKKAEKNVLDYNDLEHFTIKLLSEHEDAAKEIASLYDEIYVDEYQDTNDTQEEIIKLVSRGRDNVFMVGDMKQSIYSFRHTNPEKLFAAKSESYKPYSPGTNETNIKIALSKNFRSSLGIIDSVNTIFKSLMSKKTGGVSYEGTELLANGGIYDNIELLTPSVLMHEVGSPSSSSSERRILEADVLASRIKAVMESGTSVLDKATGRLRPIRYSDIAVLLRKSKGLSEIYKNELEKQSIPVFSESGYSFLDSKEISILISLLKVIDNPLQDIDLVAVMRSPLYNFDENRLAKLALLHKPYFYDAVREAAYRENEPDKKCLLFMEKLKKWREEAAFSGVYAFISKLIEEEGYMTYVSSMPESEICIANINIFLNYAKKSDSSSYKGLFNFLKYIENLFGQNTADKKDDAALSDINAVRIMTIHKSKGLEFPFVFLCAADNTFDKRDQRSSLSFDKELGIFINTYYPDRTKAVSPTIKLSKELSDDELISEEMRILYVALTRAREHLEIFSSYKSKEDEDANSLRPDPLGHIYEAEIRTASSFAAWLSLSSRENGVPIRIITRAEEKSTEEEVKSDLRPLKPVPYSELIDRELSWEYPKKDLLSVKNKYSVSELKSGILPAGDGIFNQSPPFSFSNASLLTPEYLNSDKVFTSAQKGSIMHYVIEHLDFSDDDIEKQLDKMRLTDDERACVDVGEINAFLSSDIVKRMAASGMYFREVPFTFKKNAAHLDSTVFHDSQTLIQGVIDCYFIENGYIVLIDYKTDKNVTDEEAIRRYEKQLSLYSEALTLKYGLPVREKYIYLLSRKKFIGV